MTAMYSFIAEEKAGSRSVWSVSEMCRTLGVSRQGFYDWESRAPSDRELDDRMLVVEIKAVWECSAKTYGAPRVHAWLGRQGFRVSRKRVARIMGVNGWAGITGRKRVRTTIVDKKATAASDLVARNFDPDAPDLTWAGDITYVPTGEGWLSVDGARPVFEAGDRMGVGRPSPHRTGIGGAGDGGGDPRRRRRRGGVPLRPGLPIHLR